MARLLEAWPTPFPIAIAELQIAGPGAPPEFTVCLPRTATDQPNEHRAARSVVPGFTLWVREPEGVLGTSLPRPRRADAAVLRDPWPVIGGTAKLAPAPLLEWQIERDRERRRKREQAARTPARSAAKPDRVPAAGAAKQKTEKVASFELSKGLKRWMALAASLAAVAFGAVQFGPSGIDAINEALEPHAAFVFFDDPTTGVGPWWESGNFTATGERTFTVEGLAINRSSIGRGDLRFDFDAKLGSSGFGFLAGVKDDKNYLAYKLAQKGRRKKEYVLVRYPVVNGEPDANRRDEFPISADLFGEDFNKFSIRVRENKLTVVINGQGVDYWTNPGAVNGGVGFFSEKGEAPVIRSVRIDGNDDFTGIMARGTIDTLRGVREMLAGEPEVKGSAVGGDLRTAGPSD